MRRLYARRRAALIGYLGEFCSDDLQIEPANSGMHLVVTLRPRLSARYSDRDVSATLLDAGITARALSTFHAPETPPERRRSGLVLGFAGFDEENLRKATCTLASTLRSL